MQGADAEQFAQPGVHAAGADAVVLVGDAREEAADQGAALADVGEEVLDRRVREEVQLGYDDEPVWGQVVLGVGEVGGEVGLPQGAVPGLEQVGVVDVLGEAAVLGTGPPGVPVVQDGDVRGAVPAGDFGGDSREVGAELLDLLVGTAFLAGVADHAGVELLGALPGLAPLEVADGVGAAGDGLQGPQAVEAAGFGVVDAPGVDRPGGLFHEHPGRVCLGAGHVLDEGTVLGAERVVRVGVDVDGDDILLPCPAPGVLPEPQRHEVAGDGDVRGVSADDVALGDVALQEHVGGEAAEVQDLRGIAHVVRQTGRQDAVPGVVALAPEGGAPGGVEGVEGAVLLPQPPSEGGRGLVAVVEGAVLVVDVPHRQGRVAAVAGGQVLGDGGGVAPVGGAGVREVLPAAPPLGAAVLGDGQGVGVQPAHPGRRRGGGGGEDDADAVLVHQVHEPVQPAELPCARLRFQLRPGEDAEGDRVDARGLHQPDVLVPGLLGPLLGVVVTAEEEAAAGGVGEGRSLRLGHHTRSPYWTPRPLVAR